MAARMTSISLRIQQHIMRPAQHHQTMFDGYSGIVQALRIPQALRGNRNDRRQNGRAAVANGSSGIKRTIESRPLGTARQSVEECFARPEPLFLQGTLSLFEG
jgi:hypothetical protein